MSDLEARKTKLNAELANGRLAMVAILGMLFQNGAVGTAGPSMWGFGDGAVGAFVGRTSLRRCGHAASTAVTPVPANIVKGLGKGLRSAPGSSVSMAAFESELGVQAPVGFWDPMGLTKDGDAEAFRRRRETELKHGRVSMLATLGYIVQEYATFPGSLSPSKGIMFSDVPSGLDAFAKVPGAGWIQIFLFCGLVEVGLFKADPNRAPGDFEKAGILGVPNGSTMSNSEARTRKLNAELANGRLAMIAIMGMLFQNGTVSTAGPSMWGFAEAASG
jgi:hypothetical protein